MADREPMASGVATETTTEAPVAANEFLKQLLGAPARAAGPQRIDGVTLGTIAGFATDGAPLVAVPALDVAATRAAFVGALDVQAIGKPCAVAFQNGDPAAPIILGLMHQALAAQPLTTAEVLVDGQHATIEAVESLELRCGQASITLTRDGQILLRGTYISNYSIGTQRIKGAAVRIN